MNSARQVPLISARVRVWLGLGFRGLQPGPVLSVDGVGPVGTVLGHVRRRRLQEEGADVPATGESTVCIRRLAPSKFFASEIELISNYFVQGGRLRCVSTLCMDVVDFN